MNNRVRKVTVSTGIITTMAGTGASSYNGDNVQATSASLYEPWGVTLDSSGTHLPNFLHSHRLINLLPTGNVYIGDTYHHRVRKVVSTGIITTIAGSGGAGYGGDLGQATAATLNYPIGVVLDASGRALSHCVCDLLLVLCSL